MERCLSNTKTYLLINLTAELTPRTFISRSEMFKKHPILKHFHKLLSFQSTPSDHPGHCKLLNYFTYISQFSKQIREEKKRSQETTFTDLSLQQQRNKAFLNSGRIHKPLLLIFIAWCGTSRVKVIIFSTMMTCISYQCPDKYSTSLGVSSRNSKDILYVPNFWSSKLVISSVTILIWVALIKVTADSCYCCLSKSGSY